MAGPHARDAARRRLAHPLVSIDALLWGLQFSFLNPSLALILVALYGAGPAEVGWVLALYNAGGFVAALVIPAWADRRRNYLLPLLACAVLTLALAVSLAVATSLPVAALALVVLGGPAGVGSSLLFAHLRHAGAPPRDVVNTRAVFSFAWVAGPPVATAVMGWFGDAAILVALALVAVLNATTALVLLRRARRPAPGGAVAGPPDDAVDLSRTRVAVIVVAFVLAQATNAAAVSVMTLFVTRTAGLPLFWAGVALGAAAALEIPALVALGRLSTTRSPLWLLITGCLAGVAYYAGMTVVRDPVLLVALQVLNAWFFAAIAGIGLTLFQQVIPRPGLASGLLANTRRVGAVISGPLIGIAAGPWGYPGVFATCAAMTTLAAALTWGAGRGARPAGEQS